MVACTSKARSDQALAYSCMAVELGDTVMAGVSATSTRSLIEIVVSFVSGMQVAAQRFIPRSRGEATCRSAGSTRPACTTSAS